MRVLFDIVHPADVLFFKRPIEALIANREAVLILSRHKDVTCGLLDTFEFEHVPVSTAGTGKAGLALELVKRNLAVIAHSRKFKPDLLVGFGGVSISHVGVLLRIPSLAFYDSDNATLQNRLTWPFISRLYVPECYAGPVPKGRAVRIRGTKDLSYLHPSAFVPDRSRAMDAGLSDTHKNFFVRVVSWRANHDLGKSGWTEDVLRRLVRTLSQEGKVHLSSENELPDDLEAFKYRGPKNAVHHVIAYCNLLVGESATMASEAAILGVPAIYSGRDFPSYVHELENAGLVWNIEGMDEAKLMATLSTVLSYPQEKIVAARDDYVADCPDWAEVVVKACYDLVENKQ